MRQVGLLKLLRGDIDADGDVEAGGSPCFHLRKYVLNDPFADIDGDGVAFDHGEKFAGGRSPPPDAASG